MIILLLSVPSLATAQNSNNQTDEDSIGIESDNPADNIDPPPPVATTEKDPSVFLSKWLFTSDTQYTQRNLPLAYLKQLKGDKEFWYADSNFLNPADTALKNLQLNNTPNKPDTVKITEEDRKMSRLAREEESSGGGFLTILLWILVIGAFIGAILWYLTSKDVKVFRKKDKAIPQSQEEQLSAEDIFAINYQREVEKAEQAGNYRLAIRLRFLRLLKQLSERNIIHYKQDKTNFDYLVQLQPTAYYNSFFRITRSYEYSWYGKFDVSQAAYTSVRQEFSQLEKQLI